MDSRIRKATDEVVSRLPARLAGHPSRRQVAESKSRVAARRAKGTLVSRTGAVVAAGVALVGGAVAFLARKRKGGEVPEGVSPGIVPAKENGADASASATSPPITAVNP
jgi:hypothetical protein